MTNEKPILFNGEMVRAILEGRKTQTRRVVKPQPPSYVNVCLIRDGKLNTFEDQSFGRVHIFDDGDGLKCPYGCPGDLLWVRETWASGDALAYGIEKDPPETILYRADLAALHMGEALDTTHWNIFDAKWRPSIFMPRWASRITLRVTDVRVERVQNISEADAVAEGCAGYETYHSMPGESHLLEPYETFSPSDEFSQLWDSINASRGYGWNVNPWVWVVTFEVV